MKHLSPNSVFKIGSPDIDALVSKKLPAIKNVKRRYGIKFKEYAIVLWHPVTSEVKKLKQDTLKLVRFINSYRTNFVVIYSNNDPGTEIIINSYRKNIDKKKSKIFRSMRFENFLSLLKNSKFIIGNSSSGIYEAPVLGVPTINIGNRQHRRISSNLIQDLQIDDLNFLNINNFLKKYKKKKRSFYGYGGTDLKFIKEIKKNTFWKISKQKYFSDISNILL